MTLYRRTLNDAKVAFARRWGITHKRTPLEKSEDVLSVLDFGVKNDGSDRTVEWNVMTAALKGETTAGVPTVPDLWMPPGNYGISGSVELYNRVHATGSGYHNTQVNFLSGGTPGPAFTNAHANNPDYLSDALFGVSNLTINGNADDLPGEDFSGGFLDRDYGGVRLITTKTGSVISAGQPDDLALTDCRMIAENLLIWDVAGTALYLSGASGSNFNRIMTQRARRWGAFFDINDAKLFGIDCASTNWAAIVMNGSANECGFMKGWFSGQNIDEWQNAKDYLSGLSEDDADGWGPEDADRHFANRYFGAGSVIRGSNNDYYAVTAQDTAGHGHVIHADGIKADLTGDQIGQISYFDTGAGNAGFLGLSGNTKTDGIHITRANDSDIAYLGRDRLETSPGYTKRINAHGYVNDPLCSLRVRGRASQTIDGVVVRRGGADNVDTMGLTVNGLYYPPTADPLMAGALWNNADSPAISAGPP